MAKERLLRKLFIWRLRHVSNRQFMIILSVVIGIAAGLAAVIIKQSVGLIHHLVHNLTSLEGFEWLYLITPGVGILLAVLFIKYIVRRPVRHGIPNVLYAISKNQGQMNRHNMISSVVASSFTVGFGGSVGLEGPTVSTGAAIGANLGKALHLNYRQITLLLGCACAGAMSAIFKAPIAAIVFVLEVIMLDLTLTSLVPLLLSSASAVVVSYTFLGQQVVYPFIVGHTYTLNELLFYVLLGLVCGLVATYFTRMYKYIEGLFERIKSGWYRLLYGAISLGILMIFFPHLFGEGYEVINGALKGELFYLHDVGIFSHMNDTFVNFVIIMTLTIGVKVIATSVTFGSGGVGGIFAPTLFMGANTGVLFASLINRFNWIELPVKNFALIGMAGLIAGVLHAPLTGLFLIADLSGGYRMFLPLMITATISYVVAKSFEEHSVYTHQLAKRKELLTHDKDHNIMTLMEVNKLIETDFAIISPDANLGDLVHVISKAHRNLFPVVDNKGMLKGMVKMDDIREIIFKPEKYQEVKVKDLMYMPAYFISPDDSMEDLVEVFRKSARFNIAVIDKGKYRGFISRANAFTAYRNYLKMLSSGY
ncbi:H(+)/Cl(-) exchange transporter ClcA [Saccharicrinis fermentans DSM 9555 = JCM 21142]|uniref:H(+)/Cl(-) exchange transporter ClcA n=2 Tax=Saccharicrinis fermentans TaxID=982 RepID=W7YKB5_9BACT|nr:H(+)/Cl(-) exchange transporter ClcA [Saccharicrinis fermentans DSM 9555 = JCM 21142]